MGIHVAICDDETPELVYLQGIINDWEQERELVVQISPYHSAEAFLFALDGGKPFDILLLDILMGGMDGVSLAKKLREINDRMQIIFITGLPDLMSEGYEVSALHYLMKPVGSEKLFEVLDRARVRLAAAPRAILLPIGGGTVSVYADEILYAEAFSHDIELCATDGKFHLRINLGELEALLGEGFFRCHRSYIVNMKRARRITRKAVVLDGAVEIPLSRSLYDAANQAFIKCR